MDRIQPVLLPLVAYWAHPTRVVDAAGAIAQHGVVLPTAFPQRVDDRHVFVGQVVTIIMRHLHVKPHAPAALSSDAA